MQFHENTNANRKCLKQVVRKLFYIAFFPKLALAFLHPMQGGKKETQEKELIKENSLLDVWYYEAQPQYKYPVLQQETFMLYVLVHSNFRISSW